MNSIRMASCFDDLEDSRSFPSKDKARKKTLASTARSSWFPQNLSPFQNNKITKYPLLCKCLRPLLQERYKIPPQGSASSIALGYLLYQYNSVPILYLETPQLSPNFSILRPLQHEAVVFVLRIGTDTICDGRGSKWVSGHEPLSGS